MWEVGQGQGLIPGQFKVEDLATYIATYGLFIIGHIFQEEETTVNIILIDF